jgi:cell division protein FtsB
MIVNKRRVRVRWRRAVTLLIVAYLAYWCAISLHHMWVIGQREASLTQKIAVVRRENRLLSTDIHRLHNPATLKSILTGRAPLPDLSATE